MNFDQAIAARGINEKQALINLKRRDTRHRNTDRPKLFATSACPASRFDNRGRPVKDNATLFAYDTLKTATSTHEYVSAWCYLNHLKGA